jgi:hypothetical protein
MAISFRPMSFHESSTTCDGLSAGLGAASFFAMSWGYAGRANSPVVRISAAIERIFFIAFAPLTWLIENDLS